MTLCGQRSDLTGGGFVPEKLGSHWTLRRREQDSNHRSRVTRPIFQCRLWLVPRQLKSRSEREPTHEASDPSPAEPMVRILFPPAASQQRTVPAVGFDGARPRFTLPITFPRIGLRSSRRKPFEKCRRRAI